MKKVKTLILRTAGTNCDQETAHAFRQVGSEVDLVHINALVKDKKILSKCHILAIPGGFTYGDDIASGKILANEIKSKINKEMHAFVNSGKLVIGICNGFQVLVKMGLLPKLGGKSDFQIEATLSLNDSGKFEDRWVHLKSDSKNTKCVWTKGLPEIIYVPIAHAEGKFIPKNRSVLKSLKDNGQVVFRYTTQDGLEASYPENPNGSTDAIAGICDPSGRILGLMPHPERHVSFLQHPNWRRLSRTDKRLGIGLKVFKNGVNFAKKNL
jgi:phosphoribosylformylglycinamidine synthase I